MAEAGTVAGSTGLPTAAVYAIGVAVLVVAVLIALVLGRRSGRRGLSQRLTALGSRLGLDHPKEDGSIETALAYLEQVTSAASEAVAESSADAIRLRRSLDTLPQGVVLCDENGSVVYRNARANALMTSRHGDVLAAQAVTELVEDAWHEGSAERKIDLYGPPRRTLTVRARLIDDGRRPLGVIAMIEDVSERRRLEEIRRDFVANVSHELKTPMGALGLLAETLVSEPDPDVGKRLASRIHTEAFRVSRIIDDLLDLSRIESEEAPPREPVLVSLVMAEAVERVRATAALRNIEIALEEPARQIAVLGDRRQLVSAMHALLENAVTYSYDNSTVRVWGTIRSERSPESLWAELRHPAQGSNGAPIATRTDTGGSAHPGDGSLSSGADHGLGNGAYTGAPSGALDVPGPRTGRTQAIRNRLTTPHAYFSDPGTGQVPEVGGTSGDGAGGTGTAAGGPASGAVPAVPAADGSLPPAATASTAPPVGRYEDGTPAVLPSVVSATVTTGGDDPATGPHFMHESDRAVMRETVRIAVSDQGIGIPARDLDRIFERFYRVDHGRSRETGGTGLGLSIVRHVANNHHGWVDVESREGEGSTFTLVLPLQPDRTA
jgi:two-component system sensor histidine kinase SenX3